MPIIRTALQNPIYISIYFTDKIIPTDFKATCFQVECAVVTERLKVRPHPFLLLDYFLIRESQSTPLLVHGVTWRANFVQLTAKVGGLCETGKREGEGKERRRGKGEGGEEIGINFSIFLGCACV